jgi:hypothetical protein
MRRRLAERKNPFGKKPEEVALMLKLNREDDRPATPSMLTPHGP